MMTKRIDWVDNMKAVAIFLVVAGHYVNTPVAHAYLYSFHVHLFFLVSGLLFSRKDQGPLKNVVTKRLRTLAAPYIIFESLRYGFILLRRNFGRTPDMSRDVLAPLYDIATFRAGWFLGVLFVVSIAYYVIAPRIKGCKSFLALAAICTGAHYLLANHFQAYLHINLPRCFTAMVFFSLGAICHDWLVSDTPVALIRKRLYILPGVLATNLTVFYFTYIAYGDSININFSRNYLSFYALSISGIFLVYIACRYVRPNAVMRFVGANTILIYLLGTYPPALVRRFMEHVFGVDNLTSTNFGFACLYAVMSIAILTPIIILINRYAPWTIGRKPAADVSAGR
jgi:acyltransferase